LGSQFSPNAPKPLALKFQYSFAGVFKCCPSLGGFRVVVRPPTPMKYHCWTPTIPDFDHPITIPSVTVGLIQMAPSVPFSLTFLSCRLWRRKTPDISEFYELVLLQHSLAASLPMFACLAPLPSPPPPYPPKCPNGVQTRSKWASKVKSGPKWQKWPTRVETEETSKRQRATKYRTVSCPDSAGGPVPSSQPSPRGEHAT